MKKICLSIVLILISTVVSPTYADPIDEVIDTGFRNVDDGAGSVGLGSTVSNSDRSGEYYANQARLAYYKRKAEQDAALKKACATVTAQVVAIKDNCAAIAANEKVSRLQDCSSLSNVTVGVSGTKDGVGGSVSLSTSPAQDCKDLAGAKFDAKKADCEAVYSARMAKLKSEGCN